MSAVGMSGGGYVYGWWVCPGGGHVWDSVGKREVRILPECFFFVIVLLALRI